MSDNLIIGLGNTGSNIVKAAAMSTLLNDVSMYIVDSVTTSIDMELLDRIKFIPIQSDEHQGSGRNRERGRAMYEFHESQEAFNEMYADAGKSKFPILVVTSAAGGTGSGATVPACRTLLKKGFSVIPIIVCPNKDDPAAFHLNTTDLLIELGEIGIKSYVLFENRYGDADYTPVNQEVVSLIEILLGKKYDKTELDSIDDADLIAILDKAGRIIAVQAEANSIPALQKEITRKVFSGFQPIWKPEDVKANTLITAFSLKSMFAKQDFDTAFKGLRERLDKDQIYDEYRNIVNDDNNGVVSASIIIAGLPQSEIKEIEGEYKEAAGLGEGMKRSTRPSFMNKKKASITEVPTKSNGDGTSVMKKFNWTK